jgi:filamentous hemagglutinin family protein
MNNSDAGGFDVTGLTGLLLRSLLAVQGMRARQRVEAPFQHEKKTPQPRWCWRQWHFKVASTLLVSYALASFSDCVLAQIIPPITPDTTLGSENSQVTPVSPTIDRIERGARRGINLFHSFEEFNVDERHTVLFANPPGVENILTRVTGTNPSNILGTLGVTGGNANLFLLNPNGINFGQSARLNVRGSFFASTANSVIFDNGFAFSAKNPTAPPLLSINVPIGLQYGASPGTIVNRSIATNRFGEVLGLQVQPGRALGLIGGNLILEGGYLTGGQIELGSVADNSLVTLRPQGRGFTVGYQGVQNFADIKLSDGSVIATSGGSDVRLQGRDIQLNDSEIKLDDSGLNIINGRVRDIQLQGRDIQLNNSKIFTITGQGRDIQLQGRDIQLNNTIILTGSIRDIQLQGQNIQLSESGVAMEQVRDIQFQGQNIQLSGSRILTERVRDINLKGQNIQLSGSSIVAARVRDTNLKGQNIQLSDGSSIITLRGQTFQLQGQNIQLSDGSNIRVSQGGNLKLDATELVEVSGISTYISHVSQDSSTGNNSAVSINTKRLIVRDGAQIQALAEGSALGGTLTVNASESVEVIGSGRLSSGELSPSQLIAASGSATGVTTDQAPMDIKGPGGNLTINTGNLSVKNGAQVSVNSNTSGNAGNLEITARSILLNDEGKLTAISDNARGGNIRLVAKDLLMRDRSLISAQSLGANSPDGNIYIDAELIVAVPSENSDIIARSTNQGNIEIKTQGIFGLEFREQLTPKSDITASGRIIFNPPDVDPTRGLTNLPTNLIDASNQINQACSANGGNVAQNELTITGRGGLPDSPNETLSSDAVWTDLRNPATVSSTKNSKPVANQNSQLPIVEANGWAINDKGQVVLTSTATTTTPHPLWVPSVTCPSS